MITAYDERKAANTTNPTLFRELSEFIETLRPILPDPPSNKRHSQYYYADADGVVCTVRQYRYDDHDAIFLNC